MKYIRAWRSGGTYFFTVNLAERSRTLLVDCVGHLRETVRKVKQVHPFDILAWVVLPDHLYAVWTLPTGDADCSTRWSLIKAGFSRGIHINPVKHGYVERAHEWPYSSIHRDFRLGLLPHPSKTDDGFSTGEKSWH
jgi:putative transposase